MHHDSSTQPVCVRPVFVKYDRNLKSILPVFVLIRGSFQIQHNRYRLPALPILHLHRRSRRDLLFPRHGWIDHLPRNLPRSAAHRHRLYLCPHKPIGNFPLFQIFFRRFWYLSLFQIGRRITDPPFSHLIFLCVSLSAGALQAQQHKCQHCQPPAISSVFSFPHTFSLSAIPRQMSPASRTAFFRKHVLNFRTPLSTFSILSKIVIVHAYVPRNGICRGFALNEQ